MQTVTIAYPALVGVNNYGLKPAEKGFWEHQMFQYTGYSLNEGKWLAPNKGIAIAGLLLLESTLGRKIANRCGANRMLRKISGNLVQFA